MMFNLPFELPKDWSVKTVEQLINDNVIEKPLDGNHGGIHPKTTDYVDSGVPFIMASDLENGRVNFNSCKFITEQQASTLKKGFSKTGDVLLSHKATIGRTALVQDNENEFIVLTPQVTYYRIKDKSKLNNQYLKVYFDSRFFQSILGLWAGAGTTRAYLGITGQLKLPVIVPPIDSQNSIAEYPECFNGKIELNHQINQTLEAMAQAIFKSWFMDFEPVKAKIAAIEAGEDAKGVTRAAMSVISGKTEKELDQLQVGQPEHYTQLKTTAEQFPPTMQDSELGEIPEGWMVRTLGSLLTELRRGISPKYTDEDGILVINQKCIRNHSVNFSLARRNDTKLQKVEGREIQVGDVLVNSTGVGTLGRLATIRYLPELAVVDSHITVVRASDEISPLFLNEYMLTKESFIEASGAGSTGQTELRKQVLEELLVVVPNRTLIDIFETTIKPISSSIAKSEQECQLLTQLRDTLLPKLLSGELSVEAAEFAEE